MSKEQILTYFKDINHAYNSCLMYDSLSRMLDEYAEEIKAESLKEKITAAVGTDLDANDDERIMAEVIPDDMPAGEALVIGWNEGRQYGQEEILDKIRALLEGDNG